MSHVNTNERELSSKIAQWFDEHIKRGNFPFSSTTAEPGIKVGDRRTINFNIKKCL
jgi:hypothetical protein